MIRKLKYPKAKNTERNLALSPVFRIKITTIKMANSMRMLVIAINMLMKVFGLATMFRSMINEPVKEEMNR